MSKDTKDNGNEDFTGATLPDQNEEARQQSRANGFPATIRAHYIKDLSIENPHSPYSIAPGMDKPQVSINVGLDYRPLEFEGQENIYEVLLAINVTAERKNHTAFIVELHYGVVCEVFDNVPEAQREGFLMTEIPRYAFPFVRQIIASATADAGFIPLYLTPVNFVQLYKQKMAAQMANAKQGQAAETPQTQNTPPETEAKPKKTKKGKTEKEKKKA